MEEAITIARGLVDLATAGRFRPETVPAPAGAAGALTARPAPDADALNCPVWRQ